MLAKSEGKVASRAWARFKQLQAGPRQLGVCIKFRLAESWVRLKRGLSHHGRRASLSRGSADPFSGSAAFVLGWQSRVHRFEDSREGFAASG